MKEIRWRLGSDSRRSATIAVELFALLAVEAKSEEEFRATLWNHVTIENGYELDELNVQRAVRRANGARA